MEDPKDIEEMTLKIIENMPWKQRKVFIAIIAILRRKGRAITEEELIKELTKLNGLEMNDLQFKNFIDAMNNVYPSMEN